MLVFNNDISYIISNIKQLKIIADEKLNLMH